MTLLIRWRASKLSCTSSQPSLWPTCRTRQSHFWAWPDMLMTYAYDWLSLWLNASKNEAVSVLCALQMYISKCLGLFLFCFFFFLDHYFSKCTEYLEIQIHVFHWSHCVNVSDCFTFRITRLRCFKIPASLFIQYEPLHCSISARAHPIQNQLKAQRWLVAWDCVWLEVCKVGCWLSLRGCFTDKHFSPPHSSVNWKCKL